jgi:Protein of unknown function (DUF3037)
MRHAFEYALLRVVPRIERGERLNAGVILYCRALDHLGAAVHLDPARLAALDPAADPIAVGCVLDAIVAQCAAGTGGARYAGPAGAEDRGRRFRRRTAPPQHHRASPGRSKPG